MLKRKESFFTDLTLLSGFFDDLNRLIAKEQRYRVKRQLNAIRAGRIHKRFVRVALFDPWKATEHIEPDVFGDKFEQYAAVMALENKRLRIQWVLWCMYHYWMFDELAPGARRFGNRYSKHRRLWYKHREAHEERLRQERWDKKRAGVRARRTKTPKRKRKGLSPEDTIAIMKISQTQMAIDNMESISDLPTGTEPITFFVCPTPEYDFED